MTVYIVVCPYCGAKANDPCVNPKTGKPTAYVHPARKEKAARLEVELVNSVLRALEVLQAQRVGARQESAPPP